ncbi:MAG TPA: hypothetical protein P5079_04330 [Elusimicrobiota bacterium]|nr:hypothetical protein [Elusimicrobiota bacterium]
MPRYFLLYFFGFWVPSFVLMPAIWPFLEKSTRKAFWITFLGLCLPTSLVVEYVYLWADVWNFSEAWDPLIGWTLFGAPVEEFFFWLGACGVIMLLYLAFDLLDRRFFRRVPHA